MTDIAVRSATCVFGPACYRASGPRWHDGELSWVDVPTGRVHVAGWTPSGPRHYLSLATDTTAGAAVPVAGGGWLAMTGSTITALRRDGWRTGFGVGFAPGSPIAEAACDPLGRMWVATRPGLGELYRFGTDGVATPVRTGVTRPGGLGWSPDGTRMYTVDRATRTLMVADYYVLAGEPGRARPLVRFEPGAVLPGGLAVDADGGIWIAMWDGAQVRRYTPDGQLSHVLPVAVSRPTGCVFAGPDLDVLVITTARGPDLEAGGGLLYASRPGVRGALAAPYLGKATAPD